MKSKVSKYIFVAVIVSGLIILAGAFVSFNILENAKNKEEILLENEDELKIPVGLIIINKDNDPQQFGVDMNEGESVMDLLSKVDSDNDTFSFEYQNSQYGAFITSVNSYTPDTSKEFWKFYINDQESSVGISDYILKTGDVIKFELDKVE